jgi:hypothetical protein
MKERAIRITHPSALQKKRSMFILKEFLSVQFHLQVIHATQAHVLSMHTAKCWEDEQFVHVWKVLKVTLQSVVILNA